MNEIRKFLIKIGVDPSQIGFEYLAKAIAVKVENPFVGTGEIYDDVSKTFGRSWHAVERGIRTAIQKAVQHHGEEIINALGQSPSYETGTYRNSAFIALCAEKVRNHSPEKEAESENN